MSNTEADRMSHTVANNPLYYVDDAGETAFGRLAPYTCLIYSRAYWLLEKRYLHWSKRVEHEFSCLLTLHP